jgi:hypothetical protein
MKAPLLALLASCATLAACNRAEAPSTSSDTPSPASTPSNSTDSATPASQPGSGMQPGGIAQPGTTPPGTSPGAPPPINDTTRPAPTGASPP